MMVYIKWRENRSQLAWQNSDLNPFEDDIEEQQDTRDYRQIYNDLLEYKETINELYEQGALTPTLMNGKTWEEEKSEWWNERINALNDLIISEKIESCEIRGLCENGVMQTQERKAMEGFWNHLGRRTTHSSEQKFNKNYNLDEMIVILEKVIQDTATSQELSDINEILDFIGTSACAPRACIDSQERDCLDYANNASQFRKIQNNSIT